MEFFIIKTNREIKLVLELSGFLLKLCQNPTTLHETFTKDVQFEFDAEYIKLFNTPKTEIINGETLLRGLFRRQAISNPILSR